MPSPCLDDGDVAIYGVPELTVHCVVPGDEVADAFQEIIDAIPLQPQLLHELLEPLVQGPAQLLQKLERCSRVQDPLSTMCTGARARHLRRCRYAHGRELPYACKHNARKCL
eukprot:7227058-Pyramimonas_sp.AAC.1